MFGYIYKFLDKVKSKLSEKGQGMVEYALIIAFVAGIAAVLLNSGLGKSVSEAFKNASTKIDAAEKADYSGSGSTTDGTGTGTGTGTGGDGN